MGSYATVASSHLVFGFPHLYVPSALILKKIEHEFTCPLRRRKALCLLYPVSLYENKTPENVMLKSE